MKNKLKEWYQNHKNNKNIISKKRENNRSAVVKYFAGFMVLMLVCTIISRGIYATQIPQITTASAEQKCISHTVEADGIITAGTEKALNVTEGIRVAEVCVEEGNSVEKGTILLKLDTEDLEQLLQKVTNELVAEQAKLNALKETIQKTDEDNAIALKRAKEDQVTVTNTQNMLVGNSEEEYNAALQKLNEYPTFEDYLNNAISADTQYQTLQAAANVTGADTDKNALLDFQNYANSFTTDKENEWKSEKEELEKSLQETEAKLSETRSTSEDAIRNANRNIEDAANQVDADNSTILEQQNVVTEKGETVSNYQTLKDANGEVVSPIDGNVEKINVTVGERTVDGAAMLITDGSEGWKFTATIASEQKQYVNLGDTMDISFIGTGAKIKDAVINSIMLNEEKMYEIKATIPSDNLVLGEMGTMKIEKQTESYSCCVPVTALYADNSTTYVLVIEESNTILGTELKVRKQEVTVYDKDDSYAALVGDVLTSKDEIVISSDREIISGDTVRLMEEN